MNAPDPQQSNPGEEGRSGGGRGGRGGVGGRGGDPSGTGGPGGRGGAGGDVAGVRRTALWLSAVLAVFAVLAAATVVAWQARESDRAELQRQINVEQQDRVVAVCDALATSRRDLSRAMAALITVSEADEATVERFIALAGLDELSERPSECDDVDEPLPDPP